LTQLVTKLFSLVLNTNIIACTHTQHTHTHSVFTAIVQVTLG